MKNFIDTVQNVILDIKYENTIFELMIGETIKNELKYLNDMEPMSEEEYKKFIMEEVQDPSKDIYGNIIGADPILYGPWKTLSNVRKI